MFRSIYHVRVDGGAFCSGVECPESDDRTMSISTYKSLKRHINNAVSGVCAVKITKIENRMYGQDIEAAGMIFVTFKGRVLKHMRHMRQIRPGGRVVGEVQMNLLQVPNMVSGVMIWFT